MMKTTIREANRADFPALAAMCHALWPENTVEEHLADLEKLTSYPDFQGFVAEKTGRLIGFAEVSVRPFANGCDSRPVAFLEGIWVEEKSRRKGLGRLLLNAVEGWAQKRGLKELGSDAILDNQVSLQSHEAWGFQEMERTVCYRKRLDA
jgi:aminoglycoside 6'-N-acetyltransferase I